MSDPADNLPKPTYKWPWFAAAAAVLAIVLAIVWMTFAVKKVESERDFSAPLPSSAPTR
jgi:bacteriorhodopsin